MYVLPISTFEMVPSWNVLIVLHVLMLVMIFWLISRTLIVQNSQISTTLAMLGQVCGFFLKENRRYQSTNQTKTLFKCTWSAIDLTLKTIEMKSRSSQNIQVSTSFCILHFLKSQHKKNPGTGQFITS